jgi:DNA (cytosine-5)-methyltransferase 1
MNVIDLFAGVGGFSTGLINAGFNILYANEIDHQIAKSYKHNHKDTLLVNSDISDFINILENEHNIDNSKSNINLIVGGPPCQGFSMAGSRIRKSNSFLDDSRNYLFKDYFKVIQKFEPEFFIFENVQGILSKNNGEIFSEILNIFTNKNNFKKGSYYLQYKVFNASDFGVPQNRKRLILIGSKIKFDLEESISETISKIVNKDIFCKKWNISDAINDLHFKNPHDYIPNQKYLINQKNLYQKYLKRNSKVIYNHTIPFHSEKVIDRIKRVKQGDNWQSLKEKKDIKSVHSGAYGRMKWDEISVTITTRFDTPSAGKFIHPVEDRNITIREAARLQSFPDDFVFYGNKTSICKQIGNAVPPLLAEFLGNLLLNIKKNDNNRKN